MGDPSRPVLSGNVDGHLTFLSEDRVYIREIRTVARDGLHLACSALCLPLMAGPIRADQISRTLHPSLYHQIDGRGDPKAPSDVVGKGRR
jgi:hypothetical protein